MQHTKWLDSPRESLTEKQHIGGDCLMPTSFMSSSGLAVPTASNMTVDTTFALSTTASSPGEDATISLFLLGNPGIAGFSLRLMYYPDALTPLYVVKNNALRGSVFVSNIGTQGSTTQTGNHILPSDASLPYINVVWASSANTDEEELFKVRFRIKNGVPVGQTPISITSMDVKNANGVDIFANSNNGYVYVLQSICWDAVAEFRCGERANALITLAEHLAEVPGRSLHGNAPHISTSSRSNKVGVGVADLILLAKRIADS